MQVPAARIVSTPGLNPARISIGPQPTLDHVEARVLVERRNRKNST